MAQKRVLDRVANGGHNIPTETIKRRYFRGLHNLFKLYLPLVDNGLIMYNSARTSEFIAQKLNNEEIEVINPDLWALINKQKDEID